MSLFAMTVDVVVVVVGDVYIYLQCLKLGKINHDPKISVVLSQRDTRICVKLLSSLIFFFFLSQLLA